MEEIYEEYKNKLPGKIIEDMKNEASKRNLNDNQIRKTAWEVHTSLFGVELPTGLSIDIPEVTYDENKLRILASLHSSSFAVNSIEESNRDPEIFSIQINSSSQNKVPFK